MTSKKPILPVARPRRKAEDDTLPRQDARDAEMMRHALALATEAGKRGEVPVGAVLIAADGSILAEDGNRTLEAKDPTAHAEIRVIRAAAAKLDNERLVGTTLYVTLEPCAMCAGALAMARVKRLVYAAPDPKGGAVEHGPKFFAQKTCHHRPSVTHLDGDAAMASAALLKTFFKARRA